MVDIFSIDWASWINLLLRWFHITAGIAWIGSSFYFIWLDYSLQPPQADNAKKAGVFGELWSVHGGGFYCSTKFSTPPQKLPEVLHWFKWEAYTTWISGFLLFVLIYYFNTQVYLLDSSKLSLHPCAAILISLSFFIVSYLCYDLLCRFVQEKFPIIFGVAIFFYITILAYGLTQVFANKAAFLHFGAILGSIMAGNVFFVIIPNQKKIINALLKGKQADSRLGKMGKNRSVHNNYLTLPVLFTMISGHYPLTFGHSYSWILLVIITFLSAFVRHHFNLKHQGKKAFWVLIVAFFLMIVGIYFVEATRKKNNTNAYLEKVEPMQIEQIFAKHCISCHSTNPTFAGFSEPPAGVSFEEFVEIKKRAKIIYEQVVVSRVMPLGNITKMNEMERAIIAQWGLTQMGKK